MTPRLAHARFTVATLVIASASCLGCGDDAGPEGAADAGADGGRVPPYDGPATLSETGLYAEIGTRTLSPDVVPFDVRFPLWSDGAEKARYLALPEGQAIDTSDMDAWVFPVGTRAWKAFTRDGVLVETRYLEKRADGWLRVAFLWRADGSDADAAPAGLPDAGGTPHDVPSVSDCRVCHLGAADTLLGVSAIQQSGEGRLLARLADEGKLTHAPDPGGYDPPGDAATAAALAYLHVNCGSCHSDHHPLAPQRTMRLDLEVGLASADDARALRTTSFVEAFHHIDGSHYLLVPGDPDASQLFVRASQRGQLGMPPFGSEVVDPTGVDVLRAWIAALPPP